MADKKKDKKKEKMKEEKEKKDGIEIEGDLSPEKEPEDAAAEEEEKAEAGSGKDKEDREKGAGDGRKDEEEESWNEKYQRLMADFQNYKKRTEKEKADVYSFANEKLMTDLLQVIDNFERALESECQDKAYAEGMQMIFKQLMDLMERSGLEEIEAKGEEFDPNFHHAVMQDNNEEFGHGVVTEVMQKGYTLNDKVIRPAMVKVNE